MVIQGVGIVRGPAWVRRWCLVGAGTVAMAAVVTMVVARAAIPVAFPSTPPVNGYGVEDAFPPGFLTAPDRITSFATRDGRAGMFLVSKHGKVYVVTNTLAPTKTVFLDNTARQWTAGESGLHGLAFHPHWSANRYLFTFGGETNAGVGTHHNRLVRWQTDPANPYRVLPESRTVLIELIRTNPVHQGGDLHFGPDGYLYVPIGDEVVFTAASSSSQHIDRGLSGGILRIDVDGRPGSLTPNRGAGVVGSYRVPPDNPWVGATRFQGAIVDPSRVRTEFWAVGFRNPHRMSFIPGTSEMLVGDVGNARWEEINRVGRGGNFGWVFMEAIEATTFLGGGASIPTNFIAPLWSYPHVSAAPAGADASFVGNCVIGGFVYEGSNYPQITGKYLAGDFVAGHIWAIGWSPRLQIERIAGLSPGPTAFGLDPATGEILIATAAGVFKLIQVPNAVLPPTLSSTGFFRDLTSLSPAPGVHPYAVANPFWSDHARKTRWFRMPLGTRIARDAQDRWSVPVGTVFVKHFDLPMVRNLPPELDLMEPLETRFIVTTTRGNYGLTYRWRTDRTDADLVADRGADGDFTVSDGGDSEVVSQRWHFPSRAECSVCHNAVAGWQLGVSTRQWNVGTQLLDLSAKGVFAPAFTSRMGLPALSAATDESATLEHRFRSYLDVNCSSCHQPGGTGQGDWDAQFTTPLARSGILGGGVVESFGIPGAQVIHPGNPDASMILRRISNMGDFHMPPLGTSELNADGIDLVSRYIKSLARRQWSLGTNGPAPSPFAEFAQENARTDLPPGSPTALDDDYYFAGVYPKGFNGLMSPLWVRDDESWRFFERAHTPADPVSRVHFVAQVGGTVALRIVLTAGGSINRLTGTQIPGFATHDMVVRVNGVQRIAATVTAPRTLVVSFTAVSGPNTIEVIRTGPTAPSVGYWINYDSMSMVADAPLSAPGGSVPTTDAIVPASRHRWILGTNGPVRTPFAEFAIENARRDVAPGSPAAIDDDYYFAGQYPAGFNALTAPLWVGSDEPWRFFERAHTPADPVNRLHFVTQTGGAMTLRMALTAGGSMDRATGLLIPGFAAHDMTVRVNGRQLLASTVRNATTWVIPFNALPGANTIEVNRTGPAVSGVGYWINYDVLSVEASLVLSTP